MTASSNSIREGRISDAHQIGRYAAHRRRAILVAILIDLEARLTDALLDMADKLIGGLFARARKAKERRYVASTRDVGRLMRLFHGTIEALADGPAAASGTALPSSTKPSAGPSCCGVRGEVRTLADLAEEDPLLGAADRYRDPAQVRAGAAGGAGIQGGAQQRPDTLGDQAAAGPQPLGQARRAGGRAHAVPQGMEAAGHRGGSAEPAAL